MVHFIGHYGMPVPEIEGLLEELKGWARQKRGSQSLLAQSLGVSKQSVSTWLSGKAIPTWETGLKLKAFLKAQRVGR